MNIVYMTMGKSVLHSPDTEAKFTQTAKLVRAITSNVFENCVHLESFACPF